MLIRLVFWQIFFLEVGTGALEGQSELPYDFFHFGADALAFVIGFGR